MTLWQSILFWTYAAIVGVVAFRHVIYHVQTRRAPTPRPDDPGVDPERAPFLSILVPAKDEEAVIERCLSSLRKLEYPRYEILVVDDRSTDRTAEIVERVSREDERVRLVRVTELPPGWTGKTHALHFAQRHAQGEWLLFVDADTTLHPRCASVVLRDAIDHGIDMETLVLSMDVASFWEGAVQPFAGTLLMMLYPIARINEPDHPGFANGQFILVNRETYDLVGGHESVRDKFVEDIHVGRLVRKHGRTVRIAFGTQLASVRMYSGLSQIVRGWSRIFYSAVDFRPARLWALVVAIVTFSLLGYAVLAASGIAWLAGSRGPFVTGLFWLAVAHEVAQLTLYARIYRDLKTPLRYLPVRVLGAVVMIWTLLKAIRTCRTHRITWRGTSYGKEIQTAA